ncbi:unnamed protein product [Paramecium pentaurelia]|uniref:Uncharacterized protein n=1 Tax=Paramecium pentaurelia TaxID=43138 RepID=A0A8S1S522_9CILI|nr:unnamed protein product [Paramecium pentaurelia]
MNKQNPMDILPIIWPQKISARQQEIQRVIQELMQLKEDQSNLAESINFTIKYLAQHAPYIDVVVSFQNLIDVKHPIQDLLNYLSTFSENALTQVVRKVNLNDLNSDSDETDFTYSDPYEEMKKQFNLKMMKRVSFPKLQKLISDIYRLEMLTKVYSWLNQITYVDYVKVSVSTIKKALQTEQLDELTINTVIQCAKGSCQCENQYLQDTPKFQKLKKALHKIAQFQDVDLQVLLTLQQNDQKPIKECVWTRQQVIQCILLFCLVQCELLIHDFKYQNLLFKPFCSFEISWNESIFSQIRDYFPKLAKKLNKRYKILKDIPFYDPKTNNQIFIYAQSLVGYYHHHINYDNFNLQDKLKQTIKEILENKNQEKNLPLLIIVSNAIMFAQLLKALK